jgi:hypothetical protein
MARRITGAAVLIALSLAASAPAHEKRAPADTSGVPIPFVTHGEMAVLAPYRSEILTLAERVREPGTDLHALMRYSGIQHANCLWGLVPGSLEDEESPFNQCAHADLAATKEILFRLRQLPEIAPEASGLVSRIDTEMTQKGAAFIGCQYSGEGFNTAEFIRPDWTGVPGHPTSMLFLSAMFFALPTLAFAGTRFRRRLGAAAS